MNSFQPKKTTFHFSLTSTMGSALYRFRFANIQHLNTITNTSNNIIRIIGWVIINISNSIIRIIRWIIWIMKDGDLDKLYESAQVDVVIDAIKSGASSIILTLGCGKYRLTDLDLGTFGGL
eukprot:217863_1